MFFFVMGAAVVGAFLVVILAKAADDAGGERREARSRGAAVRPDPFEAGFGATLASLDHPVGRSR